MRAVWSFWSKPYYAYKGRIWHTPLHHFLAWGLSLHLARRHYPETVLITDRAGKAVLVDHLGLSFTSVSTELERIRKADVGWWALGKLVSYNLQDKPFLHLDTDVFLWKALPRHIEEAPVFAQCPEHFHSVDEGCGPCEVEQAFASHNLRLPTEWEYSRSQGGRHFREENCGVVGGTRHDFFRHYSNVALDLVLNPANAPAWAMFPQKEGLTMIVEQFLLGACLDYHQFHPASPYRGIAIRYVFPSFEESFNSQLAARVGFTHLLGDIKSNPQVARRLEERVRHEDPAFYQHCLRLSRNPRFFAIAAA
jgi:hypothetical protein